ncbi:Uncharacterized protein Fot_37215 [Forsythia ovata]|uniref:Uncharacterized protein n=1 Tax=Forsythia ovata TaxID=205694 RepID=A0ABD1SRM9_9LAMI
MDGRKKRLALNGLAYAPARPKASQNFGLLKEFYQTALKALEEAKNKKASSANIENRSKNRRQKGALEPKANCPVEEGVFVYPGVEISEPLAPAGEPILGV